MKVNHYEQVPQQLVEMEGSQGCSVRWLLGERDGTPHFAMRQFEVAPGGYTPRHFHPYEHEVFVLEGEGVVLEGETPHSLKAGDVVLVKPDEVHQFRNTGDGPLKFLCLIPNSAAGKKVTVAPECGRE
ncbi:MAG TPA: cupin domain-containing protein [Pirellulaceae bacterium]|nr:cupin domain-containing protein [Pirellulaceae bacterium]